MGWDHPHLPNQGKTNEWYTPPWLFRRLDLIFALDPCAPPWPVARWLPAVKRYTISDDGLNQPWGGRVWLNPPYGIDEDGASNMGRWATELIAQYEADIVTAAILCVNCLPFAPWWKQLKNFPVCMTDHRPRFRKPVGVEPDKHGPTNGSAFFYLGPDVAAFVREFDQFGPIYGRIKPTEGSI